MVDNHGSQQNPIIENGWCSYAWVSSFWRKKQNSNETHGFFEVFFKIPGINDSLIINFFFFFSFWRNPKNWLFLWIKIQIIPTPPNHHWSGAGLGWTRVYMKLLTNDLCNVLWTWSNFPIWSNLPCPMLQVFIVQPKILDTRKSKLSGLAKQQQSCTRCWLSLGQKWHTPKSNTYSSWLAR